MAAITDLDEAGFATRIGLRYVSADEPGIARRARGKGFSYHAPDGTTLSGAERQRCEALVVPPAWQDVWICADPLGHLQAAGTDDAGRRQYRYHERWTDARRLANFDRLRCVGRAIGDLRPVLASELTGADERRRALAAMVRLVDRSLERIGNEASAELSGSFGISTLRADHLDIDGSAISLSFTGKGGVDHETEVSDRRLAAVLAELVDGDERVFEVGDHEAPLTARDANLFLAEISKGKLHCKDFRTWGGTAIALEARVHGADEIRAVDAAAEALHNTRAVARSAYVHPDVVDAPAERLGQAWAGSRRSSRYRRRERALIRLLEDSEPLVDQLDR